MLKTFTLATGALLLSQAFTGTAQTIPAYRTTDWTHAGLQDTVPSYKKILDISNFGADKTGALPCDASLQAAISAMNDTPGVIYFPTGTYLFTQQVNMTDSLVLRGNDRSNTKLIFNLSGPNDHMLQFKGTTGVPPYAVTQPVTKDDTTLTLANAIGIQAGDWLHLYGNDVALTTSAWAFGTVGQIVQVKAVNGNIITIRQKMRRTYEPMFSPQLRPVTPLQGSGIECMYIKRKDANVNQTNNINFDYAVNCWVIGVESDTTDFCHVAMSNSAHLLVRGNYFHHAHAYGQSGQGYGVAAQYTTGDCVVENNIFEHLRHSMLVQAGANGNVFAYNYSQDPYWDEPPLPANSAGDAVLHGNYPYMNLFEGNVVQHIVIDNSHGINGPHNTFFRNRAEGYGIFMNTTPATDSVTFVGNEITNTSGIAYGQFNLQGTGHFQHGNNHKGTIKPTGTTVLPETRLHYSKKPGFWYPTGPNIFETIGTPFTYNSNKIPASLNEAAQKHTDCRTNPKYEEWSHVASTASLATFLSVAPNPTNNITTFQYRVSHKGACYISITDMTGRTVKQLSISGAGSATWDASNVPAGLYLYRLTDGNHILQTGKLVVTD
jgi:hypothetical protein